MDLIGSEFQGIADALGHIGEIAMYVGIVAGIGIIAGLCVAALEWGRPTHTNDDEDR